MKNKISTMNSIHKISNQISKTSGVNSYAIARKLLSAAVSFRADGKIEMNQVKIDKIKKEQKWN